MAAENLLFLKSLRRLRAVRKSESGLAATENPQHSEILRRRDSAAATENKLTPHENILSIDGKINRGSSRERMGRIKKYSV